VDCDGWFGAFDGGGCCCVGSPDAEGNWLGVSVRGGRGEGTVERGRRDGMRRDGTRRIDAFMAMDAEQSVRSLVLSEGQISEQIVREPNPGFHFALIPDVHHVCGNLWDFHSTPTVASVLVLDYIHSS